MGTRSSDRQLDLFGARLWDPERRFTAARGLADALAARVGEPVRLLVHDNRSTMVSFRRHAGQLRYRVHHMFLDAPQDVVEALAAFARPRRSGHGRPGGDLIDAWVREHRTRIGAPHLHRLRPCGRVHDLRAIFDRLNAAWFGGRIEARIGWGARRVGRRRGRRTIKTGVYVHDAQLIRIHPVLDRPEVPERYVAAVVFHEMLHQAVPSYERDGRHVIHGREFRARERGYPDHAWAKAWEREHLRMLLDG